MICLLWLNDMSPLAQRYVFSGSRRCLLRFNDMTSQVQEYSFVKVMTSVGRSAEPSQHVCSL